MRVLLGLLQDKLETRVKIDSVSVNFTNFDVNLWGVDIEDRQQRKMLLTDRIAVKLDVNKLLHKKIEIESAWIDGLSAELYNPKDSASNFQFVIDAFKTDKPAPKDTTKREQLSFDIHRLRVSNTSLHYVTDNHQPRKNTGKPKRGFFDAGHLDITARIDLTVHHIGKDTASLSVTRCEATDSVAGLFFSDIHFDAGINKQAAFLTNVAIKHLNTSLSFDSAAVVLPNKKQGRKLQYTTSVITGRTQLKDIARPFAPVLSRFAIPVEFKVNLSGTDSTMHFANVRVNTPDQKLKVNATGYLNNLSNSKKLFLRFRVNSMNTDAVTAKRIIDQFVVKKFMMRQLNNLGAITYTGSFDILYKMEKFRGVIGTSKGHMRFNLTLNELTKYLTGHVRTSNFRLGQVIEMKDIGNVGCTADFTFDYSKPRTAIVRKRKGGKLPIGKVTVSNVSGSYKKVKFNNISATITSDGAVAEGLIVQRKKMADILCHFTFNNTDSIQKMKIKPGLRLRNMPWQRKGEENLTKQEKQAAKAARKAEKAARKEEKAKLKAEKKALKAEKKAQRKAEKEK